MERGAIFQSAEALIWKQQEGSNEDHFSQSGKSSPLDFLAQASLAFHEKAEKTRLSKWITTVSDGREKITVVPGPAGSSVRLHRGNGRLPPIDLSKPFAKKCRNRECNNLGGQLGKPRSIYCSKRCQSREQNLRQGRIKNVRSNSSHTVTVSIPTALGGDQPQMPGTVTLADPNSNESTSGRSSVSPRSSPSPLSMSPSSPSNSPPLNSISASPPVSPVPLNTEGMSPSPSPLNILTSMSPNPMMTPNPLTHTLTPSPLTLRLGMTPSPIPMSPSPLSMSASASSFSPIQMTSSIPNNNSPIFLPKPAPLQSAFSPATKQSNNSNFTPSAPSPQRKEMENLTLAPILS